MRLNNFQNSNLLSQIFENNSILENYNNLKDPQLITKNFELNTFETNFLDLTIKKIPEALKNELMRVLKKEYEKRLVIDQQDTWDITARQNQKIPEGDWFGWLILAGRGFGKTRAGAEAIKKLVQSGQYKRIALIGENYDAIKKVMIEGESGLLNLKYQPGFEPTYLKSKRQIVWPNDATATFYSAETPEQLRGPQFDLAWIDELAKFNEEKAVWNQLMFCLRLGKHPKVIITTTPRPKDLIFSLINRSDIHVTKGTTFENKKNLPKSFIDIIEKEYANTKFGNQEILGELISKEDSQLWNYNSFIYEKVSIEQIHSMEVIITVDPAMTSKENSDETGIIVAGKKGNLFYILEDASGKMDCNLWIKKIKELFEKYNPIKIVVENNQGGDILMSMLQSSENLPWESVRAKIDKYSRAIPIAALYEQKKVVHAEQFKELEEQLLKAHIKFADDRLDALTWAIYELNKTEEQKDFEIL